MELARVVGISASSVPDLVTQDAIGWLPHSETGGGQSVLLLAALEPPKWGLVLRMNLSCPPVPGM
jgi:hypothetical protein